MSCVSVRSYQFMYNPPVEVTNPFLNRWLADLQRFLGFANFYRIFIQNYNQVVAPLTCLVHNSSISVVLRSSSCIHQTKTKSSSPPLQSWSNQTSPNCSEIDASDAGVGANSSQRTRPQGKLQTCAFFSHCLSSAEQNYVVENRELLAINLALEE